MNNEDFQSGLQRLVAAFNSAIYDKRWSSADQYLSQIWDLYSQRAYFLEVQLTKFREVQINMHSSLTEIKNREMKRYE